ncbi:hypothetical protein [Qipengyuania aquimaris]|uniref:hypothetical protein n=1 Tax=Qipengyuania aquimaris TaxID=255984 RepID=UPI001FD15F8E|nr:hypothetical protein [Qipengyuania aquimaris]UOR15937.1 hypothetical protein LCM05_02550 [Qipengyuania aquimaris]
MIARALSIVAVAALLAGCAEQRFSRDAYARALHSAPGAAQPSRIIAREIEKLQRAREVGRSSALSSFASSDATLLPGGELAASWTPKLVWMSCDGRFAVSDGRFETADGKVGEYVTSWRRNLSGDYDWLQTMATLDDPQPPKRPEQPAPQPGEIVVDGLVSADGRVAHCKTPPTALPPAADGMTEMRSRDRTLAWRWNADGAARNFEVMAWTADGWAKVMDHSWPAQEQE